MRQGRCREGEKAKHIVTAWVTISHNHAKTRKVWCLNCATAQHVLSSPHVQYNMHAHIPQALETLPLPTLHPQT